LDLERTLRTRISSSKDIWPPLIAMDDCNLHESVVNYFKVHSSKCFVEMWLSGSKQFLSTTGLFKWPFSIDFQHHFEVFVGDYTIVVWCSIILRLLSLGQKTNPCAARANVLRRELPQLVCLGTCSGADEETWSTLRFLRRARCASLEVGKNLALRRFSFLLGPSVWLRSSDTWYPIKKLVLLIPNLGFGWPGQSFSRLRKEGHHNRQQKKSSLPGKSCGCCVTSGSCGPLWVWQRCGFPRLEWSEWRNSELDLHYNGHHSIRRFASNYCDLNRLTCPPTK
jgi:hypothetical protein